MTDIDQVLSAFESVNVVHVRARDVLLFRCPGKLSVAQRESAAAMLNEVFPDHESIVLEGGQDIAVLRAGAGNVRADDAAIVWLASRVSMSFSGIAQFNQNLRAMMNSDAFKNADEGQKLEMGGLLLRSKYGLGSWGGFGPVKSLPDPAKTEICQPTDPAD